MVAAAITDHKPDAAILATLCYYAIFQYPLKPEEVHKYSGYRCSISNVYALLEEQVSTNKIYTHKGYYTTLPKIKELVARREKGNELAKNALKQAMQIGRIIYNAPFVKFVGISGSLSKGFADDRSDFDFFIITSKNRLWICRTLLHLFKKLTFLAGQQRKFCMNYFVDESALKIEEQNIYTATELASLVPVRNTAQHHSLLNANQWMLHFLPNYNRNMLEYTQDSTTSKPVKSFLEFLLNLMVPETLNRFLMKFTDNRWRRKWAKKNYPEADYPLAFKTTLNISKNHPANYQKKILAQLKTTVAA